MATPDQINAPATFNSPGELFNDDNPGVTNRSIIQQVPTFDEASPRSGDMSRGRVLKSIGAVTADFKHAPVTDTQDEVKTRDFTGSFTLVRSMRVVHQHRTDFWGEAGIMSYIGHSALNDPDEAELDTAYNDMLLNNYMPSALTPSKAQFSQWSSPRKRVGMLIQNLATTGTTTGAIRSTPLSTSVAGPRPDTLPEPPPFAENLQSACNYDNYFRRGSSSLQFGAEEYRDALAEDALNKSTGG